MGAKCSIIFVLFVFICFASVHSHPIPNSGSFEAAVVVPSSWSPFLALAFTVTCAVVLLGCLSCCKQRAGFKEFRNSISEPNVNAVGLDFVNPLQEITTQPSRYSIFSSFVAASTSKQPESVVTFEPLPRVLPNKSNPRLPQFNTSFDGIGVTEDWLNDRDFPREQLHYLRECGQGWFGKVVESEARGIVPNSNKIQRVFVRILKEDATAAEQAFFLREAKPYRDLSHPNVLKLVGRCLENVPFLLVFEACSNGDLKSYLKQNIGNRDALVYQGVILRMAVDIASGLSYMLQNTFVHTDIAARNCLVTGDLRVKVGDYGTNLQNYKEEYYFNGDIALPIRWCAPETLKCTETVIEPQQVTGASCIWSYGVLLWELEEWGELPYKELSNDEVISRVFGSEGLRLPCPSHRTPCTEEIYEIMKECWKDYADRPSFIHVMNALSALLHRFKSSDFDSRWQISKPNTIAVTDNDKRTGSLPSKGDNDSGIDLDNPKLSKGLSLLHLQQGSPRHRVINDEYSSDSPSSSRRFSNSSTAELFSSPISMKHRSPSLENLHGSLDNISSTNRRSDTFESGDFSWFREQRHDSEGSSKRYYGNEQKLDFRLGLVSNNDGDALWNNNQPLFQPDSLQEDNSLTKRIDSLGTDTEDEIWRKRIERGEFTEKVKEKSKSVADLMILTHIDCSESSESDSLPSFHSRQSSFNKQCRRGSKSNAPLSLLNSLSFGSESNLPVVEKDLEFQDTLKKIQIAKINGGDDSLTYMSLQTNSLTGTRDKEGAGKFGHFLANEASKKRSHSSHISPNSDDHSTKNKLPLFDNEQDDTDDVFIGDSESQSGNKSNEINFLDDEARTSHCPIQDSSSAEIKNKPDDLSPLTNDAESISYDVLCSSSSSNISSPNDADSVVIGPSESHTLEYFKGLKTTLVDDKPEAESKDREHDVDDCPQTLNDFLNDSNDDYFYKCDEIRQPETRFRSQYCDYCYVKCHFSNECLKCKDKLDDNCSCESFENLEKFRDCATLNSCPFQSDDSGRGTDQINSGDGSSDKSLEGSISVQMNEVKNRLEDVIAKFAADDSDNSCSSLEDDKDLENDINSLEIQQLPDGVPETEGFVVKIEEADENVNVEGSRRGSLFAISEENEISISVEEDTCVGFQSQSEDSGNFVESKTNSENANFVKVEQLFFSVDPKLEKEIEEFKSVDTNITSFDEPSSSFDADETFTIRSEISPESGEGTKENDMAYEISDILEGLSEPISLPYSVNEHVDESDSDSEALNSVSSNWLPSPIDDDRPNLEMDEKFVEAIRNELLEKLPNTSTLAIVEPEEVCTENTNITIDYNTYPSQLSPILEEEEYSSLSSIRSNCSSHDGSECSSKTYFLPDDVLVVNTETNEASILDKTESSRESFVRHKLNETYEIEENEDTVEITDNLDSDSLPTPDSLSPGTSSKTGAHLSYSSSESGNLSDVFLSPSSSKNFDEFENDKSPCDARHLNTPENILYSPDMPRRDYQAMMNIDQLLKKSEQEDRLTNESQDLIDPVRKNRDQSWLKSFFMPYNDTSSLVDFNSMSDTSEAECRSLPADFKSENWPAIDELVTKPEEFDAQVAINEDVVDGAASTESEAENFKNCHQPIAELSVVENSHKSSEKFGESKSNDVVHEKSIDLSDTKVKNSLALFGNTTKQIRNFHVSLVKDDNYTPTKTSPTSPKCIVESYLTDRLNATSVQSSEKTWKTPLNGFLSNQNLESFGIKEINVNDLMSTSFIESGSQDGSVDDKDENFNKSDSDSEDGEVECTNDEFEWKKQIDNVNENEEKNDHEDEEDDDEDDEDDEELADFVPYSWNVGATPRKSALKSKEKTKVIKKNVSFKKQKYHCVYEYPKEETNYTNRIYDNLLQDHMFNLWNIDRDYLYGDYSSFSDWELDDCEEQTCSDDLLPYPGVPSTSSKNNISNKLGFYTIGAYDVESTKSNASEDSSPINFLSSPGSSVVSSSIVSSPVHAPNDVSNEEKNIETCPHVEKYAPVAKELNLNNLKDVENDKSINEDYINLPSPGLGELKHTKNRLKLDLANTSRNEEKIILDKNVDEDDLNTDDSYDYGLNFKPCDISPVVELSKSLTSASVA